MGIFRFGGSRRRRTKSHGCVTEGEEVNRKGSEAEPGYGKKELTPKKTVRCGVRKERGGGSPLIDLCISAIPCSRASYSGLTFLSHNGLGSGSGRVAVTGEVAGG